MGLTNEILNSITIYESISEKIKTNQKTMNKSSKKYIINDIALSAGVSPSTVSRVFNKRPYVKEDVRQKVLKTAAKLNYAPKVTARKDNVAVISSDITGNRIGSYADALLASIVRNAVKSGLGVEIVPMSDIDIVFENFVRAIIAIVHGKDDLTLLSKFNNIPVLTVNNIVDNHHYVCTNHFESIRVATNKLIQKGHSRIAFFSSPKLCNLTWGCNERIAGYKQALFENSIPFCEDLLVFNSEQLMPNLAKVLLMKKPTALIAGGEGLALPIWHSLRLLDKNIPDDISVILFEAPEITPYLFPSPTVIKQNFDSLGEVIIKSVMHLLDGTMKKIETMLPVEIENGESIKDLNKS